MHLGHNNSKVKYNIDDKNIEETVEEKDLGIIVAEDFKSYQQCIKAANTGNKILGMIKRTIVSRNKDIIMPLNKSLVRPDLDYCIQAWKPHLRKDINTLEKIQRRATKLIEECRRLGYNDRLRTVRLTTLETRMI